MGFDQITDALGNRERRLILLELLDHNPVDQRTVVATVGRRENLGGEVQFVHHHLPKLDDMGYIEWVKENANILKGPNWEEIEPILRLLDDNRSRIPSDTFDAPDQDRGPREKSDQPAN